VLRNDQARVIDEGPPRWQCCRLRRRPASRRRVDAPPDDCLSVRRSVRDDQTVGPGFARVHLPLVTRLAWTNVDLPGVKSQRDCHDPPGDHHGRPETSRAVRCLLSRLALGSRRRPRARSTPIPGRTGRLVGPPAASSRARRARLSLERCRRPDSSRAATSCSEWRLVLSRRGSPRVAWAPRHHHRQRRVFRGRARHPRGDRPRPRQSPRRRQPIRRRPRLPPAIPKPCGARSVGC
jgi:hypothetical protein